MKRNCAGWVVRVTKSSASANLPDFSMKSAASGFAPRLRCSKPMAPLTSRLPSWSPVMARVRQSLSAAQRCLTRRAVLRCRVQRCTTLLSRSVRRVRCAQRWTIRRMSRCCGLTWTGVFASGTGPPRRSTAGTSRKPWAAHWMSLVFTRQHRRAIFWITCRTWISPGRRLIRPRVSSVVKTAHPASLFPRCFRFRRPPVGLILLVWMSTLPSVITAKSGCAPRWKIRPAWRFNGLIVRRACCTGTRLPKCSMA